MKQPLFSTSYAPRDGESTLDEIERVKGVHHTTLITWVKRVGERLPNAYDPDSIPEVGELDELETFIGQKKQNLYLDGG